MSPGETAGAFSLSTAVGAGRMPTRLPAGRRRYEAKSGMEGDRRYDRSVPKLTFAVFEGELAGIAYDGAGGALDLFGFGDGIFRGGAEFAEFSSGD